ncbi:hypothetical protein BKA58DRAFT_68480 [Alternaria rosae]|uniref:uncharacterized protein n=1 Tax=Alternaria rosae TaxID=1187941 RepID=UPI001E8E9068|nr:uncharacterized protein BKA58DRAFT_68480 [Alternaria rosae]KAH6851424.1 hypothetical protein BKA58DRAFT_68480 [Alternaria rosae]
MQRKRGFAPLTRCGTGSRGRRRYLTGCQDITTKILSAQVEHIPTGGQDGAGTADRQQHLPDAKPLQPSSLPPSPAPPRKRQRMGTVNAPILLSSDVQNEDHIDPEQRDDECIKVVCASKLHNDMPFPQKVTKDTYIFLRQMRPDLKPWDASVWDTNDPRGGTLLGGCMFAQVDPAKSYKQKKLVEALDELWSMRYTLALEVAY